jgi:hypothetical protein
MIRSFVVLSICVTFISRLDAGQAVVCNDSMVTVDFNTRLSEYVKEADPASDSLYLALKIRHLRSLNEREFAFERAMHSRERNIRQELKLSNDNYKSVKIILGWTGFLGGLILWLSGAY